MTRVGAREAVTAPYDKVSVGVPANVGRANYAPQIIGVEVADERQLSAAEWRVYFDDLRQRAKDPAAALSLEEFRAIAHLELLDRVRELESALGKVERALRYSRQI